jgi:phosphoglycolate phosphatase-like HAD superfamily hydrolase
MNEYDLYSRVGLALAIGVAWGYHTAADLVAAGAECVAQDFGDLLGLIESVA